MSMMIDSILAQATDESIDRDLGRSPWGDWRGHDSLLMKL
jgi:hypothetical protein